MIYISIWFATREGETALDLINYYYKSTLNGGDLHMFMFTTR